MNSHLSHDIRIDKRRTEVENERLCHNREGWTLLEDRLQNVDSLEYEAWVSIEVSRMNNLKRNGVLYLRELSLVQQRNC